MSEAIVDANVVVAYLDEKDSHREEALKIWSGMEESGFKVWYLDCVLNETISALCRRYEERKRSEELPDLIKQFRSYFSPDIITWTYNEIEDSYDEILNIVEEHKGKLNFHDALIVLFARFKGIRYIVSFDKDFDDVELVERVRDAEGLRGT